MSKTFRLWKIDEPQFLPASVQDFVVKDHLARFMVSLVTEELDLIEITASYLGEKGQPPFHPAMMVALLLYAYCCGIYSSRRIAKACRERVDFMSIVASNRSRWELSHLDRNTPPSRPLTSPGNFTDRSARLRDGQRQLCALAAPLSFNCTARM
jgi:hypothetical protein